MANCRQLLHYLHLILEDVDSCTERIAQLDQRLLSQLAELQGMIGDSAQPWASVSPLFNHLSSTWTSLQDEMVILSNLTSLTQTLQSHTRCVSRLPSSRLSSLLEPLTVLSDEQRLEASSLGEVDTTKLVCDIIYPGTVSKYDSLARQFSGFCPVALLSGGGFLLPGNAGLGTLRWKGRNYVCSTADRIEKFGAEPELFIQGVRQLVFRNSVLEQLLNPGGELENLAELETRTDAASQTETHPLTSLLCPDYRWNEWDLRREALNTCKLR